jgi:hypothetical protein
MNLGLRTQIIDLALLLPLSRTDWALTLKLIHIFHLLRIQIFIYLFVNMKSLKGLNFTLRIGKSLYQASLFLLKQFLQFDQHPFL